MIDTSLPGSWRSYERPTATCAVCCQEICGHSDAEFDGRVAPHRPIDGAPGAADLTFHEALDSAGGAHDHA